MKKIVEIALSPQQAFGDRHFPAYLSKHLHVHKDEVSAYRILKRSIDSRQRQVLVRLQCEVYLHEAPPPAESYHHDYPRVTGKTPVLIIGAGPAGLFAALRLIERGLRPVILERGKDVHARKYDIARLNREHKVNGDSNYCFGEGGAGTFSDGKLYTRSTKRGDLQGTLKVLVAHGADPDILIDAHPHIGSDRLPTIIEKMRSTILEAGGEVHFGVRVTGLICEGNKVRGVIDATGTRHDGKAVILATGHSAREVFLFLQDQGLELQFKPFAMGVRVEHPQELIDQIRYHGRHRGQWLPAASYSLVHQASGRGVFSFCMCPGGIIVPSASGQEQLLVNGMSNSRRNSPYANAGIVAEVREEDLQAWQQHGALKGLAFQESVEKISFLAGGSCQTAPAQRLTDFLEGKLSQSLPDCSYHPGIKSYPLAQVLPSFLSDRLIEGFRVFAKKMPGFITEEAVVVGVESRTSSPVRIPRDKEKLSHPQLENFFPAGEGSGYAGGILSSAMDGERVADAVAGYLV